MLLRMLRVLSVLAVAMAASDDVISRDTVMTSPRDVYPGVGEYFYVGVPMTWTEAMKTCNSSNAHLLVIESAAEAAAIRDMMIKHGPDAVHLGFNDIFTEGKYNDIFGQPIDAACRTGNEWAEGYPVGGAGRNCGGFIQEGFINTQCQDKQVFICEIPSSTSGNTTKPGYTLVPGHGYYKLQGWTLTTWADADQTCRDEGSHLLILNSEEELEALKAADLIRTDQWYHIGIHRYFGGDGDFTTVLGGTLANTGFSRWVNGEPLGSYINYPYVRYRNMQHQTGYVAGLGNTQALFICEVHKMYIPAV